MLQRNNHTLQAERDQMRILNIVKFYRAIKVWLIIECVDRARKLGLLIASKGVIEYNNVDLEVSGNQAQSFNVRESSR